MENLNDTSKNPRREFLGTLATGAAAIGLATLAKPIELSAANLPTSSSDPESMFNQLKGKHRIVYDVTKPHAIYPFAWPRVFMLTNEATGTPSSECGVVVVLRHEAIPFAMNNSLWEKYKFGDVFKVTDPKTNAPALRNPFWEPKPGDYSVPGVGPVEIGINQLQASGVLFCVCEMAITVFSARVSGSMQKDAAEMKKEWLAGVLPGVQPVPSGVWALGRAQEKGCGYIFAS